MASTFDRGFIAGAYNLYWDDRDTDFTGGYFTANQGNHLGITGPEGIRLTLTREFDDITGDATGDTVIDACYKGGQCQIEFVLQQINTDPVRAFLSAFRETSNINGANYYQNEVGLLGQFATDYAGCLKMEPVSGSTAALAHGGNGSRVFAGMPFGDLTETLDAGQSVTPVTFRCLPFVGYSSSITGWWERYASP
jgi:hypothetical protein